MNCANHPDRERVAFCQHCGKPICQECIRNVGSSVYCESCLATRLSGANAPGGAPEGAVPPAPPPAAGVPNPGLAGLLGIIPGVGAMYNGQYAKGIVHLVVFAILVSLSNENGIFGLFIAGWVIYQIIEAYHTARARRDGTPLPNPFGLNDLGEKLGFGKAWPAGTPGQPGTPPTDSAAQPSAGAYAQPPAGSSPYTAPPAANWGQQWHWESYASPPPPYVAPPFSPVDPNTGYARNRFPTGAVWLIALGAIFLIANSHIFHGFPMHWIVPFLLIGFGVWLFVQRMTAYGAPLADDGTPQYRYRVFHALRGPVWIVLVGVMFLLDSFGILSWGRSWPLFIIVAGLMAVLRGVAYSGAPAGGPYYPPNAPAQPPPASTTPPPPTSSSIVPSTHDEEGS